MNLGVRRTLDRLFTGLTGASIVLLMLVLMAVLGPMIYRGSGAVLFDGTVEFRRMQRDLFNRADRDALSAEIAETDEARQVVYEMIDRFKKGIDIAAMSSQAREINREYRGVDRATDVLSFPSVACRGGTLRDNRKRLRAQYDPEYGLRALGEFFISLDTARRQASDFGHSLERELAYLAVHAMFHLFGYDHVREEYRLRMRRMEESALAILGVAAIGLLALVMAAFSHPSFIALAFDSGGVATGSMSVSFIMALAIGVTSATPGRDPAVEGLGTLAIIAMTPILTVLALGLVYKPAWRRDDNGDEARADT